jgi:glycosyltransferase 2 family protein
VYDKLKKNLVIALLITAIIFFILSAVTDSSSVLNSFKKFNWLLLPFLLLLSFGNYFTRFLKWQFYLKLLKINIPKLSSFKIFISGFAMSASPAKMGEVLKSLLLKEMYGEPISKTAPIIFAERLTDFLSLTFLTIVGIFYFNYSAGWIYIILFLFIMMIVIIGNRPIAEFSIKILSKISFVKKHSEKIINLYESAYILLQLKPILLMLVVSIIAWSFECFGFYIILINFNQSVTVLWPTFVYALSTIAGAASMLPGGLGVTEGSLSLILINGGIAKETAIASTFIVRVVTLWFAIILGAVVLFFLRKEINNSD